jgi:hypothetical protein
MDFEELAVFTLQYGSHDSAEEGLCAMEAVAWLEGLPHDDRPKCTCPIIANFVREINDMADDEQRQRLVAYLPRLVGTVSPDYEMERAEHLVWAAITRFATISLDEANLSWPAKKLRSLTYGDWSAAAVYLSKACSFTMEMYSVFANHAMSTTAHAGRAIIIVFADELEASHRATNASSEAVITIAKAASCMDKELYMDMALEILDGLLAIGPASSGFSTDTTERIAAYRELVT